MYLFILFIYIYQLLALTIKSLSLNLKSLFIENLAISSSSLWWVCDKWINWSGSQLLQLISECSLETMVRGNTESLNYVGNDGTCDLSWQTMILGNTPLNGLFTNQTNPNQLACGWVTWTITLNLNIGFV